MKKTYIYKLIDPRSNEVRYIGKTVNPQNRMWQHIWDARTKRKHCYNHNWINSVVESGEKPVMEIIEECDEEWADRERFWIKYYRDLGCKLTNVTEGGEGVDIPNRSKEWYIKVVETKKKHGKYERSPDSIERARLKQIEANKEYCRNGHKRTDENTDIQYRDGRVYRNCLECASIIKGRQVKKYTPEELVEARRKNGNTLLEWNKKNKVKKSTCIRGHKLEGDNLRILFRKRDGIEERICRQCVRERNRECKRRKREKNAQINKGSH